MHRDVYGAKLKMVRGFMAEHGFDSFVLARRDSFSWLTGGGDSRIFLSSDVGVGFLVIGPKTVHLVAESMDCDRIYQEELGASNDIIPVTIHWYDAGREACAMRLTTGNVASDIPLPGATCAFDQFQKLFLALSPPEIERFERAGALADEAMRAAAERLAPGMSEIEAQGALFGEYGVRGFVPKVVLVGSDERIGKYRHPLATKKKMERSVLLHMAAAYGGLHANITRMMVFGDVPAKLRADYDFLNQLQAMIAAKLRPGTSLSEIVRVRKEMMAVQGVLDEYDKHYPGATTGYFVGDASPIIHAETVQMAQGFDWFLTLTGCKVEELILAGENGGRVLSATGAWPLKTYSYEGFSCDLPDILQK